MANPGHPWDVHVRVHHSVDEFREIAEPLYRRDPVGNTIELTLLRSNRFGDDALLATLWEDGAPIGAALQTPPYPLACNGIPDSANGALAIELARIPRSPYSLAMHRITWSIPALVPM